MTLEIMALFFETFGTIAVAFAALSVHHKVMHEHTIDKKVLTTMRKERTVGFIGVWCVVIGFILNLFKLLN